MVRSAFIHGSSVGQSTFLPKDAPSSICNDIADKYFKGRIPRQKESDTEKALFVDLYKSTNGELYCVYSFVNNYCRGANEREGQYFALSILSKGVYLYPEDIYRMLSAAYEQMFNTNKILGLANGEVQYRISQFSEQEEYLSAFLERVITILDNKIGNLGKVMEGKYRTADYDSWRGVKTSLDVCNSLASYNDLYEIGRLYISDSYESPSVKNKSLEDDIKKLKKERADLEERIAKMMKTADSKARDEIDKLQKVINEQEVEIKSSKSQLEEYEATIDIVHRQLDKYAKYGQKISNAQEKKLQYEEKDKKDILKICLLFIVMFLTIVNGVLSYCFFRDFSPTLKKETKSEIEKNVVPIQEEQPHANQTSFTSSAIGSETESSSYLTVVPNSITVGAQGDARELMITTNGVWKKPVIPDVGKDWLSLEKIGENKLQITVGRNTTSDERKCTFMIGAGSFQQQITVTQNGKVVSAPTCPDYDIMVTDTNGRVLAEGDTVTVGQILKVTISNPEPKHKSGYGWTASGCNLGENLNKNVEEVSVTVIALQNETAGPKKVVVGYGKLDEGNKKNGNLRKKRNFVRIVP